jgi:hypothetical protein
MKMLALPMAFVAIATLGTASAYAHGAYTESETYTHYGREAHPLGYAYQPADSGRVSADIVYDSDGRILGQDPDPNVRLQLQRDIGSWNR